MSAPGQLRLHPTWITVEQRQLIGEPEQHALPARGVNDTGGWLEQSRAERERLPEPTRQLSRPAAPSCIFASSDILHMSCMPGCKCSVLH